MNVLVTGGAGFIGSHLSEALLARGDSVFCVDSFNDYYSPELKRRNVRPFISNRNYRLFREDILNVGKLAAIFRQAKPDRVVHLAARVGVRPSISEPFLYADVNVKGTLHLLELARVHKVRNFVFASSSSVYGNNRKVPFSEQDRTDSPASPYGATKKAGELLCYSYHSVYRMSISCLRFFTVYGERGRPDMAPLKFTRLISGGMPVEVYGDGRTKRDYTYVGDIVRGVVSALDADMGYEVINLGNSEPVELQKLISVIEREVGKKARLKYLPVQQGDMPVTYADVSKARRLLGFTPKTRLEVGIKRLVDWHRSGGGRT